MAGLQGWHLVIILVIILLLFGAPKLPALAKSLGQSVKILRKEVSNDEKKAQGESADADSAEAPTSAAPMNAEAQTPETSEKTPGTE